MNTLMGRLKLLAFFVFDRSIKNKSPDDKKRSDLKKVDFLNASGFIQHSGVWKNLAIPLRTANKNSPRSATKLGGSPGSNSGSAVVSIGEAGPRWYIF